MIHKQGIQQIRQDVVSELTPGSGVTVDGTLLQDGKVDGLDASGVEAGATADQTGAEIKTAYDGIYDHNNTTERWSSAFPTTYEKIKQIQLNTTTPNLKITFGLRPMGEGGTAYVKIYRNGGYVGAIEHSHSTNDWTTKTEYISGWAVNDTLELWIKADVVQNAVVRDLKIKNAVITCTNQDP